MCEFKLDDMVICVINSSVTLTIGKEYKVYYVDPISEDLTWIEVVNDAGDYIYYNSKRFISKGDMRDHLITNITK